MKPTRPKRLSHHLRRIPQAPKRKVGVARRRRRRNVQVRSHPGADVGPDGLDLADAQRLEELLAHDAALAVRADKPGRAQRVRARSERVGVG
jgi:hypothetical protein